MNRIAQFSEDIMNCRFCWMCRQVCTVGRLTRDETQSPRSRALLLASIEKGMFGYSEEISEVMYKCCLCGYCQSWCKGKWTPPPFIKASRADLVDRGLHGQAVRDLAARLIEYGNYYGPSNSSLEPALAQAIRSHAGRADVVLLLGHDTIHTSPEICLAAISVLEKAGITPSILSDEDTSGFDLFCLGYVKEAIEKTQALISSIKASGCATIVTLAPADRYYLTQEICQMGMDLDGVAVVSIVEYLAALIDSGSLKITKGLGGKSVAYHDTNYYARYCDIVDQARVMLRAIPEAQVREMLWYGKEAHSMCDSLVRALHPDIAAMAVDVRVADIVEAGPDIVVTSSAYDKRSLEKGLSDKFGIRVMDMVELIYSLI